MTYNGLTSQPLIIVFIQYVTVQQENLTVIKFGGLPSKCVQLILTGFNLTDWSSTIVFMRS